MDGAGVRSFFKAHPAGSLLESILSTCSLNLKEANHKSTKKLYDQALY